MSANESTALLSGQRNKKKSISKAARSWIKDFQEFLTKGDFFGMATGIIIGGAFSGVVSSIVDDLFSPFISLFVGNQLQNAFYLLREPNPTLCTPATPTAPNPCENFTSPQQAHEYGAITLNYGITIQRFLNFLIVGLILFAFIRAYSNLKARTVDAAAKKLSGDGEEEHVDEDVVVEEQPVQREVTTKVCPYCAQEVPKVAVKCMYCTSELPRQL